MKFLSVSQAAVAVIALAGCQAVYPTQYVPSSPLTFEYQNDSYDFKVVNLTPTSAREANEVWAYTPRPIPNGLLSDAAPANGLVLRATSVGDENCESDDCFLLAQVSQNVSTFESAADFRNPPPSPSQPYRIGVGDVFTVTIDRISGASGDSSVSQRETSVDFAGNIFLTDVGEIQVLGLTAPEARRVIADSYRDARLSANGSATVTGFRSQKYLVSTPGKPATFEPITNTPQTLRDAYLRYSSGIDRDAQRQVVVLRRDGRSYPTRGQNVLRQTYGYDVFLRDGDELQIFDEAVNNIQSAAVSPDVLALQSAQLAEQRFQEERARAEESANLARLAERRAVEQQELARINAQLAQNAESRATRDEARRDLEQARAARDEARRDAEQARATRDEARRDAEQVRAARDEARRDADASRAAAAEQRAARQLQLSEESQSLSERSLRLNELNSAQGQTKFRMESGVEVQDRIFISGEVRKQMTVAMPFGRQYSLAEAIYGSEGIEPITGDPSRVYVVRVKSSVANSIESYIFNFDGGNLANTAAMTMFEMRPNDLVVVMPRRVTNWSRFMNQLIPTFSSITSAARVAL